MHDRVEELVLELSKPVMRRNKDIRRAQAEARLIYFPADSSKPSIQGEDGFLFDAPLGPIEKEELKWYLERYHIWPAGPFKTRAESIEQDFPKWGKEIYMEVFGRPSVMDVYAAWKGGSGDSRRFTVLVNHKMVEGTKEEKQLEANEAASLLLGMPWELMHDGSGYLFQGAKPIQVRRQLPNTKAVDALPSEPPIRILLVSPRPEDKIAGYFDHRVSAIPLLEAVETLGGLVELKILTPPTFPALEKELDRAREEKKPYHVVHFDGHGAFTKESGLGSLCFEKHEDSNRIKERRSELIDAKEIAAILKDYRISLFYLDACQSAQAEKDPTASVAAALLKEGTASVVAMSHTVLIETAKRFVNAFYKKLAGGARIGDAMKAGHKELYMNKERGKVLGAGTLTLRDWFVPVLYQEKEDVALFKGKSAEIPVDDELKAKREASWGKLKQEPDYPFTGRSRELLTLERMLEQKKYLVICGQGGEGKTTIAEELGRWLLRTNRIDQVVFVCVEEMYDTRSIVDEIGRQLLEKYSVAEYPDNELMTRAMQPIEAVLKKEKTLIIFDNMESILPPANHGNGETGIVLQMEVEQLRLFFDVCVKLNKTGNTQLVFTSRESLPSPFDAAGNRFELDRLERTDAIKLVTEVMANENIYPKEEELGGTPPNIDALVESVNGHARSLVLLAPYIGEMGVNETRENIEWLMVELDRKHPGEREKSLFACIEMSLRRLSPWVREAIKPLAVFKGGGHFSIIQAVLELDDEKQNQLVAELIRFRLVELMPYNYLRFHPALSPYLLLEISEEERIAYTAQWAEYMVQMSTFLYKQTFQNTQVSFTLTLLQLPNLMALLEYLKEQGSPEQTVDLATSLEMLFSQLGRKQLLAQVVSIRETESKKIKEWSRIRFNSVGQKIERLIESGQLQPAWDEAQSLLEKCTKAGETAYPGAAYDTAMANWLKGRILKTRGVNEAALHFIDEAYRRFHFLGERGNESAARMASASLTEKGDCYLFLGRLEESADAYQLNIKSATELKDERQVAVGKGQLGTVRMEQGKWDDALAAYREALEIFTDLGESASVATILHQTGMVHEKNGNFQEAEDAYRQSLAIKTKQNNPAGEASSLLQLGNLYDKMNRWEEAVVFYRQAAEKHIEIQDLSREGVCRNNLANTLIKLNRFDEARQEILRAIECLKPFGHSATPWRAYDILCDLEKAVGNDSAATEAREQAFHAYLSYRRAGGENHTTPGKLCTGIVQMLKEIPPAEIGKMIAEQTANMKMSDSFKLFVSKLLSLLGGNRERSIWEDTNLDYDDAVELSLLLERLTKSDV